MELLGYIALGLVMAAGIVMCVAAAVIFACAAWFVVCGEKEVPRQWPPFGS